ncbi:MAG: hypothetical protein KGZ79_06085 [Dethiobacter sp.]|jgi:hypothetical protein|nr:hypothetical protein [Dethiobacter sp.]
MRKLISVILIITLVLSLATVASAKGNTKAPEYKSVDFFEMTASAYEVISGGTVDITVTFTKHGAFLSSFVIDEQAVVDPVWEVTDEGLITYTWTWTAPTVTVDTPDTVDFKFVMQAGSSHIFFEAEGSVDITVLAPVTATPEITHYEVRDWEISNYYYPARDETKPFNAYDGYGELWAVYDSGPGPNSPEDDNYYFRANKNGELTHGTDTYNEYDVVLIQPE